MNLQALVELRKSKKVTQVEMAKELGMAQSVYQRIEAGIVKLKAEHLPVIARKLDVSVADLAELLFYEDKSA